jgi:hypothetical protein
MYDDDDDDDRSDWQRAKDDAVKEHLQKVAPGVPLEEMDEDLFAEAERAAIDVVGPDPDRK